MIGFGFAAGSVCAEIVGRRKINKSIKFKGFKVHLFFEAWFIPGL
jgi:hypothetical protein